jgi:Zn finger protein HypA/HybF involved in hydrogenase expression
MEENETVFKIDEKDIKKTAVTQCPPGNHQFKKLSENEIYCPLCQSAYIVNNPNDYLNERTRIN